MSKMLFAAVAATLLAGPAFAQSSSIKVSAAGVNFNDRAQVQTVYARIAEAARQACTTPSDNRYVAAPDKECVDRAVAEAVKAVDKPLLTAAYENTSGLPSNRALAGNDQ